MTAWGKFARLAATLVFLGGLATAARPAWAGFWSDLKKTVNSAVDSSKKQEYDTSAHDVNDEYMRDEQAKKEEAAKKKAAARKKASQKKAAEAKGDKK